MSIIASAIAGGLAGAGAAGEKVGLKGIDADIQTARDEAIANREIALQKMREEAAVNLEQNVKQPHDITMQDNRFTNEGKLQDKRIDADDKRQDKRILADKDAAQIKQDFDKEQHELNRGLTREQIQAQKDIAASNHGISLQIAKLGGTPQQDKEGNMIYIDKAGNASKIMDPANPTEQLKGFKDLSPAAKAMMDVIKAQLTGLNAQETGAMGDAPTIEKINQRRVALNQQMLNIATMGVDGASGTAKPAGDRPPLSEFDKGASAAKSKSGIVSGALVSEPPGTPRPKVDGKARDAELAADAEQEAIGNEAETERLRGVVKNSKTNPAVY